MRRILHAYEITILKINVNTRSIIDLQWNTKGEDLK
jgi:hypothetical protein